MGRTSRKRQKKKLMSVEITECDEEILTYLKSWLLTNNCLSVSNLIPYNFPVTGRGLQTLKDIKANDILIQIPCRMLITTATVSQSYINILFARKEYYSAQLVLSVFLIYETHLGCKSKWYHYLSSLPQSFTNPEFCSNKEKRVLPTIILDYMNESHRLQNEFSLLSRCLKILSTNKTDICPHCNNSLKKIITYNRYRWAYYVVNTRAVYVDETVIEDIGINIKQPNNLALAPFLDLFNHDVHTTVSVSTVSDKTDEKVYQIVTLKPFNKGSQVFINYGSHNNLKLYVDYGFYIPDNPLDEISFDISDIQACFVIPKCNLDFITANNLHRNMSFVKQGLNYNAMCTLYICSTKLQKEHWSTKIYGDSYDIDDVFNINSIARKILNLKINELLYQLKYMKNIDQFSQSFSVAIALVEEYITLLNESQKNLRV